MEAKWVIRWCKRGLFKKKDYTVFVGGYVKVLGAKSSSCTQLKFLLHILRYYGRRILHTLNGHGDLERMLSKYLPSKDLNPTLTILENLRSKVSETRTA